MENSFFLQLKDKIPADLQLALKKKLENLSSDKIDSISMLQLKDPKLGLILSILLGGLGVDRFYQGKILHWNFKAYNIRRTRNLGDN